MPSPAVLLPELRVTPVSIATPVLRTGARHRSWTCGAAARRLWPASPSADASSTRWYGFSPEAYSFGRSTAPPRRAEDCAGPVSLEHLAIVYDSALGAPSGEPSAAALALLEVVLGARAEGVPYVTFCLPSALDRAALSCVLEHFSALSARLCRAGVRVRLVGEAAELPNRQRRPLELLVRSTEQCNGMHLTLTHGAGTESGIVQAARALAVQVRAGLLLPEEIDEAMLRVELGTAELPNVDLLVGFGGGSSLDELLFETRSAHVVQARVPFAAFGRFELQDCVRQYRLNQARRTARDRRGEGLGAHEVDSRACVDTAVAQAC